MGTLTSRLARGRTALAAALTGREISRELRRRNPDGLCRRRARCGATRGDRCGRSQKDPALARRVRAASRAAREGGGRVFESAGPARSGTARIAARGGAARRRSGCAAMSCSFPRARARAPSPPWRAREWVAMAASLVLGVLISWRLLTPDSGAFECRQGWRSAGARRARAGARYAARERTARRRAGADRPHLQGTRRQLLPQLRAARRADRGPRVPRRFRWQVPATDRRLAPEGEMQQAGSALPPAILRVIEARMRRRGARRGGREKRAAGPGLGLEDRRQCRRSR